MGDVEPERILVFDLGDKYVFSYYFEHTDVFDALRDYYESDEYRFELPDEAAIEELRDVLGDVFYEVEVVEDLEPYCVVKDQYTEHAEILKRSVVDWTRDSKHFFLMQDETAVKEALERGAERVGDTKYVVGL